MKLLFDQNIPRKIVSLVLSDFPGSLHVVAIGFDQASDRAIWDYAAANDFAIVSKDADFHHMSFLHGAPPKTIWIRIGNCTTAELAAALSAGLFSIRSFLEDDEAALLILDRPPASA